MSLEIAKELLKKGMALNDQELIAMANSLIDQLAVVDYKVTTYEQQKKSSKKATKKPTKKTEPKNNSDFVMKKEQSATKKIPVNKVKNRKNTFFDDKTEAIGDKTPEIKLAPRDRPKYKPVYKQCANENCNKKVKVVAGDGLVTSYLCDSCILGRKRG